MIVRDYNIHVDVDDDSLSTVFISLLASVRLHLNPHIILITLLILFWLMALKLTIKLSIHIILCYQTII